MKRICFLILLIAICSCGAGDDGGNLSIGDGSGGVGISGSLAGFAVVDDFLYVLANDGMSVLDISEVNPTLINRIPIQSDAETIYRYGENLLLGTRQGMIIYDISIRSSPRYMAEINHQTACDPVVAIDSIAYVTTRSGQTCNNIWAPNQMIVVNLSNLSAPEELKQIQMINPRGLGFWEDKLFVCEGDFGLKVFDIVDRSSPEYVQIYDDIAANDVIVIDGTLIVTGSEGIWQFSILSEGLELLSQIR
ncbi:MAG: hypothetical protein HRT61_23100 [Ekhidna sp.]|nr:hypothetical protein [Ekhidna sp.]